jgi:hypothetical protein
VVDELVAAEATPAAASMVPAARAPVTSTRRTVSGLRDLDCSFVSYPREVPADHRHSGGRTWGAP